MKRNPNPHIQRYKKLHREKVKRKTATKRLSTTYCKISKASEAICRIACKYGASIRFLFAVYEGITGILNKCIDEAKNMYFINKKEGE